MKKYKQNNDTPGIVKVKFSNDKAAKCFLGWLSASGEQDYWDFMKKRELEEDGAITAIGFIYHYNSLTVDTDTSRLDKKSTLIKK